MEEKGKGLEDCIRGELEGGCENDMLCQKPYVKVPSGIKRKALLLSDEAKMASTPFPCGQCLNCRINKSRMWATRIGFEHLTAGPSSFVTLTYNDDFVPKNCELDEKDVRGFFKRLRYYNGDKKIRYFYCGEYGDKKGRPHYHIALFGVPLEKEGIIEKSWTFEGCSMGMVKVGDLNAHSARYISGYIVKGMNKKNEFTKDFLKGRRPEFQRMSRRPGIGYEAMKLISEKCKKNGVTNVSEVMIGRRRVKLGRYLQSVIDNELKVSEEKRKEDFFNYQNEMFDKWFKDGENFIDKFQKEMSQKRVQQIKRNKIFSARRISI